MQGIEYVQFVKKHAVNSEFFFKPIAFVRPVEYNKQCITMFRGGKMEFMTASQAAKLWHISQRRVQILCAEGRIPGVFKLGEAWAIPADVEKPTDKRKKMENESNEHT